MLPDIITAGATLKFQESLSEYTASEACILNYTLINSTHSYTISSTAENGSFDFNISTTITTGYAPGSYSYQKYINEDGEITVLGEGIVTIKPLFSAQTTYDDRSHAQKMVEAIEALLENRATAVQSSMTYKNRALQYLTFDELIKAKNYYENEVQAEINKKLVESGGTVPRLLIGLP